MGGRRWWALVFLFVSMLGLTALGVFINTVAIQRQEHAFAESRRFETEVNRRWCAVLTVFDDTKLTPEFAAAIQALRAQYHC